MNDETNNALMVLSFVKGIPNTTSYANFILSNRLSQATDISITPPYLVLDIDINDAMQRQCCKQDAKNMCNICFYIACRWMHYIKGVIALTLLVKRSQIMVTFSGRRGFHFWISGYRASQCAKKYILQELYRNYLHISLQKDFQNFCETVKKQHPDMDARKICPRLLADEAVTLQKNHKLRLPFSVNPNSHRLVVAMDDWQLLNAGCYEEMPDEDCALEKIQPYLDCFNAWLDQQK